MCYVPGTSQEELDYGLKGGHMCYVPRLWAKRGAYVLCSKIMG